VADELLDTRIIGKGAEALVYVGELFGKKIVVKQRISKPYRHRLFDEKFRRERTRIEGKILVDLYLNNVHVPTPLFIDVDNAVIIMEYIRGRKMIELVGERILEYAYKLGVEVGKMHSLNIYHGDLTLGNVIVSSNDEVYLIDFGLAGYSRDVEEYAIDLHLLRRNLYAVAPELYKDFFDEFLKGYRETITKDYHMIINRFEEIRLRGRYVEERLRKKIERDKYIG
jgi:TP53 regulating kinase-like protein